MNQGKVNRKTHRKRKKERRRLEGVTGEDSYGRNQRRGSFVSGLRELSFWIEQEGMRDLGGEGGVRGRGLIGSNRGDKQREGTRTHVRRGAISF